MDAFGARFMWLWNSKPWVRWSNFRERIWDSKAWIRWNRFRHEHNWVLFGVAGIALTRGLLYTVPSPANTPRGLELLPDWALPVYGGFWLFAGIFGIWQVFRQKFQDWARWLISGMAVAWSIIYGVAAFYPYPQEYGSLVASEFWALIALIAISAKPRTVHSVLFVVHRGEGEDGEPSFEMIEIPEDSDGG